MKKYILYLVFLIFFMTGCGNGNSGEDLSTPAGNIILFIGDGMGSEHLKAARWLNGPLFLDGMLYESMTMTASFDGQITDSAAAATALATGIKTDNGIVGLDINLHELTTILEDAKNLGKSVGLVTTVQIAHATPAAFAAHVESRAMMNEIALQFIGAGVDVLFGGGEDEFLPDTLNGCYAESGERNDGHNLIAEAIDAGYTYVCDYSSFNALDPENVTRVLGLFADEGMIRPYSPALSEMTQKAINILSKNPNGFFLMVEGGQIDWASHSNDAVNAINDTIGLDDAVNVAKTYSTIDQDTLIIVTSDHETGGMNVSTVSSGLSGEDGPFFMPGGTLFYVTWETSGHTGENVLTTAHGPYGSLLTGTYENTVIHDVMYNAFYGY